MSYDLTDDDLNEIEKRVAILRADLKARISMIEEEVRDHPMVKILEQSESGRMIVAQVGYSYELLQVAHTHGAELALAGADLDEAQAIMEECQIRSHYVKCMPNLMRSQRRIERIMTPVIKDLQRRDLTTIGIHPLRDVMQSCVDETIELLEITRRMRAEVRRLYAEIQQQQKQQQQQQL